MVKFQSVEKIHILTERLTIQTDSLMGLANLGERGYSIAFGLMTYLFCCGISRVYDILSIHNEYYRTLRMSSQSPSALISRDTYNICLSPLTIVPLCCVPTSPLLLAVLCALATYKTYVLVAQYLDFRPTTLILWTMSQTILSSYMALFFHLDTAHPGSTDETSDQLFSESRYAKDRSFHSQNGLTLFTSNCHRAECLSR